MKEIKVQALRDWMVAKGCLIHPHIQIPADFSGVQGVGTSSAIPPKTLIIAVPSSLILTVTRCYNDPLLKKLFLANDDLFDYQATQDAQFNVLCVFLMYHRLNIEKSQWRIYLQTIAQPQTAVDWQNQDLKGLNKSVIEQIIHVRLQCSKLESDMVEYLSKRKEFKGKSKQELTDAFHYCYRAVMTRCFGYYFDQTCLIPIADLINHGCQAVDHQLMNVYFEKGSQFQEGYYSRSHKIDCQLFQIPPPDQKHLPFRERFLVENSLYERQQEKLAKLNRENINKILYDWNKKRLEDGAKLKDLHFCSQDEQEDNDTDEEFEVEQERQMEVCRKNQQEQRKEFMNHYVKVQRYADVEQMLDELGNTKQNKETTEGRLDDLINQAKKEQETAEKQQQGKKKEKEEDSESKQSQTQTKIEEDKQQQTKKPQIPSQQATKIQHPQQSKTVPTQVHQQKQNPFSNRSGVPIQMMQSSSQQSDDEQEWGLQQGSYFTMSTSSGVGPNQQLFNSYGSRTNKFLMIWYGFTYRDNLFDSVSFRLQVQFGELRPAQDIVLDSYVGGQGLSFKKANSQIVKQTEISRQFRMKRTRICEKLIIFLRLYLMHYYKGEDLYKLFVTFPASVDFEIFVLNYYKDVVKALYDRYPISVINELKEDYEKAEQSSKVKINFKIIYLQQQRKLLDINLDAVLDLLKILHQAKQNGGVLRQASYSDIPIQRLRMIRHYLISYEENNPYILYKQQQCHIQQ